MISWSSVELEILDAVSHGVLIDKRSNMPSGPGRWRTRNPSDIVGQCIHQSAGLNVDDPMDTAFYHTGPNHISDKGLPGICYCICIHDTEEPPWLTSDFKFITWAQGAEDKKGYPGDENRHLIPILVMGSFKAPGYKGRLHRPTENQMRKLARVTDWLGEIFNYSAGGIFGHYHFGKPTCPGSFLTDWVESLRNVAAGLTTDEDWQRALCIAVDNALPVFGIDGMWGAESRSALIRFQREQRIRVTGVQDAFTELKLMRISKEKRLENT